MDLIGLFALYFFQTWETELSFSENLFLQQFLPKGTDADIVVKSLLTGENLHFGNSFTTWHVFSKSLGYIIVILPSFFVFFFICSLFVSWLKDIALPLLFTQNCSLLFGWCLGDLEVITNFFVNDI